MAITTTSLQPTTRGWTVAAYSANFTICETLVTAPGAGRCLCLERLTIHTTSGSTSGLTVGQGKSGFSVETVLLGAIGLGVGRTMSLVFSPPLRLEANKSLTLDGSAAAVVLAQGYTL